jgi:hypothetical protein
MLKLLHGSPIWVLEERRGEKSNRSSREKERGEQLLWNYYISGALNLIFTFFPGILSVYFL